MVPGLILLAAIVAFKALDWWGTKHATFLTGGAPHPSNCVTCHVYPQQTGILSNLLNEDYLSPLKIAVTPDGQKLLVTSQEGNTLLVVDAVRHEVMARIPVGLKPHTAVCSTDGRQVFVTNQWSNTVSVADLKSMKVVNTINVGGGPSLI
jgi:YVTN family beta-propeller protein